ncbi:MAG: transposase [Chloroflexota bacterium]|nr:transposase [Chloroflexota bacterium]
MNYPRRKRPRLATFDYTDPGPYFVTICLSTREPRFGRVVDGIVVLNAAGEGVHDLWLSLPRRFPTLILDAFVVMPDHLHGILTLHDGSAGHHEVSLGDVIKAFKSQSTTAYIHGVRQLGWPPFAGKLWQYNYYEHIIRDDRDLETKRAYIEGNPGRWQEKHS